MENKRRVIGVIGSGAPTARLLAEAMTSSADELPSITIHNAEMTMDDVQRVIDKIKSEFTVNCPVIDYTKKPYRETIKLYDPEKE